MRLWIQGEARSPVPCEGRGDAAPGGGGPSEWLSMAPLSSCHLLSFPHAQDSGLSTPLRQLMTHFAGGKVPHSGSGVASLRAGCQPRPGGSGQLGWLTGLRCPGSGHQPMGRLDNIPQG